MEAVISENTPHDQHIRRFVNSSLWDSDDTDDEDVLNTVPNHRQIQFQHQQQQQRYDNIRTSASSSSDDPSSFFAFLVTLLRKYLKVIVLVLTFAFLLSLKSKGKESNNWDLTRRNAYADMSICDRILSDHYVDSIPVLSFTTDLTDSHYYSILFENENGNKARKCIYDANYDSSNTLMDEYDYDVDKLTSRFTRDVARVYFPYLTVIIILSIASFVLTVLFENTNTNALTVSYEQGRFLSSKQNLIATRLNGCLIFCIIGFLFVSSNSFTFTWIEDCYQRYTYTDVNDFCSAVDKYGLDIVSVISPDDYLVNAYRSISLSLSVLLIIACAISNNNSQSNRTVSRNRFRVNNRRSTVIPDNLDDLIHYLSRYVNNDHQNSSNNASNNTRIAASSEFANSIINIAKRNRAIATWKTVLNEDGKHNEEECAICLSSLFSHSNTKVKASTEDDADEENSISSRMAKVEDPIVVSSLCGHLFHRPCLLAWRVSAPISASTCPICRKPIDEYRPS